MQGVNKEHNHSIAGVVWVDEVESTNLHVLDHFSEFSDGMMLAAGSQRRGRGRRGREWLSPPNVNIYASYVLKPFNMPSVKASWIGGLAVLDALRTAAADVSFWLKWPNDVYVEDRKIAGVLCEMARSGHAKSAGVVVGIGVNVNMDTTALAHVGRPATSLLVETGRTFDLRAFAVVLRENLLTYQRLGLDEGGEALFELWRGANALVGRTVSVCVESGEPFSGTACGVRRDGALVVALADGSHREVRAGDVSVTTGLRWF